MHPPRYNDLMRDIQGEEAIKILGNYPRLDCVFILPNVDYSNRHIGYPDRINPHVLLVEDDELNVALVNYRCVVNQLHLWSQMFLPMVRRL